MILESSSSSSSSSFSTKYSNNVSQIYIFEYKDEDDLYKTEITMLNPGNPATNIV
jgi:hypothetical protein